MMELQEFSESLKDQKLLTFDRLNISKEIRLQNTKLSIEKQNYGGKVLKAEKKLTNKNRSNRLKRSRAREKKTEKDN